MKHTKPTRKRAQTPQEKKFRDTCRALGLTEEGAKRIMRTGQGSPYSRIILAKAMDLSDDELIYGTTEAARMAARKTNKAIAPAGGEPQLSTG